MLISHQHSHTRENSNNNDGLGTIPADIFQPAPPATAAYMQWTSNGDVTFAVDSLDGLTLTNNLHMTGHGVLVLQPGWLGSSSVGGTFEIRANTGLGQLAASTFGVCSVGPMCGRPSHNSCAVPCLALA